MSEVSAPKELFTHLNDDLFDVLVIDPMLCRVSQLGLLGEVRRASPMTNILVLTEMSEAVYGMQAFNCGAKGYLHKTCTKDDFIIALERARTGRPHVSERMAEEFAIRLSTLNNGMPHENFSKREFDVFSMLVCGRRVSEIATQLQISVKTVSTHKARVLMKLGNKSLIELIRYAISQELTEKCRLHSAQLLQTKAP
jgi:DNA-binding NarL/FixJ family response regulator